MSIQQTLEQALEIAKQRLGLFATDLEFWIPTLEIRPMPEINGRNTA